MKIVRQIILIVILMLSVASTATPASAQWGTTDLPQIGTPAPIFELPDNEGQLRALDEFRGRWVVLYFYPKDFTSGCTIEARRFQQDSPKYQAINAQILGISADSVESHRKFCDAEGLTFPLLSDLQGGVGEAYGSWLGDIALRNTFIIDPEGILQSIFPIVNPSRHSAEVLSELKTLQQIT